MVIPTGESNAKKSLGQHWLNDPASLQAMCQAAEVGPSDIVLEIGPGYGSLTRLLIESATKVVAVEKDEVLAGMLRGQNLPKLEIIEDDILKFDFSTLPTGYKIVANIPYYLTAHLLRQLTETINPPSTAVLLVQKEVAERVCASQGQMNLLAVSVQLFYEPSRGKVIPSALFVPSPKVDSQILVLHGRTKPLFKNLDTKGFFRIVKAGFAGKRKKLRGSLAAGLNLSKERADDLLAKSGIDGNLRAQNLSLDEWHKIYSIYQP